MTVSIGVDVGSGVIKTALFRVEGEKSEWLARWDARIRQRNAFALVDTPEHEGSRMGTVFRSSPASRNTVEQLDGMGAHCLVKKHP